MSDSLKKLQGTIDGLFTLVGQRLGTPNPVFVTFDVDITGKKAGQFLQLKSEESGRDGFRLVSVAQISIAGGNSYITIERNENDYRLRFSNLLDWILLKAEDAERPKHWGVAGEGRVADVFVNSIQDTAHNPLVDALTSIIDHKANPSTAPKRSPAVLRLHNGGQNALR